MFGRLNTNLNEIKTELKKDITDVRTDVAGLKKDVAELKKDVAELKTDVADLKKDVAGLKTEVVKINKRIDSHDKDITYIKHSVNLGECRQKSFWRDGWLASALLLPAVQLVSTYVITYANTEKDKKE